MTNRKSTKRALLTSCMSLLLCFAMLLGTTFAWFTDSASTSVNKIQAGNLKVVLEYSTDGINWSNAEGKTLKFMKAEGGEDEKVLWEPGCTYNLPLIRVRNNGNLALKYELVVTGVDGDADLLKAIEWTGNGDPLTTFSGTLEAKGTTGEDTSEEIQITGHMKEEAGNEYQDLSIEGIGITVYATQLASEFDSNGNQYDAGAPWTGIIPESIPDSLVVTPDNANRTGTITINSPEALVYLPKLAAEWANLYSDGNGTTFTDYKNGKGEAYYYAWGWTIELGADLNMNNIPMDPINTTFWGTIDGNGHTISNVVVNCPETGYAGLFYVTSGLVENLKVNNVKVLGTEKNDNVGAVVGYCRGSMDNVHVTNATISGNKYVGTVAGKVENGITNSSATNATVTAAGKTAGGLVGYTLGDTTGNTVDNVKVTGLYNVGGLLGQAQNKTVENNTVKNTTVTSTTVLPADADSTEVRTGEVVARNYNATVGTNTVINTVTALIATPENVQSVITNAHEGATIQLSAGKYGTIVAKSNITILGVNGAVVDCVNLNGANKVNLLNIEFNAAGAQAAYRYSNDSAVTYANIVSGSKTSTVGARNILIDGCVFTGKFANGGAAIAFTDRSRPTGGSGNVTIKNCSFNTENAYYDVYGYYTGTPNMTFSIENNTFASNCQGLPIYLGRLATSEAIVVNVNNFKTTDNIENSVYIQAHSDTYTPTLSAANNTFGA